MGTPVFNRNVQTVRESNIANNVLINSRALNRSASVIRAINHKLRRQMMDLIEEKGKMTVTEIFIKLRLDQPVASQHLAILRRSGILETERKGKFIYYFLNERRINDINNCLKELSIYSSN